MNSALGHLGAINGRAGSRVLACRAAQLTAPGEWAIVEVELPPPAPGEVQVRLEGCGVCASGLPLWEGRPWFSYPQPAAALGHEAWGRIEVIGPGVKDAELQPGRRVAVYHGDAYRESLNVSSDCVVPLPPFLDGLPFPGEPLACAMNIFERAQVPSGTSVAIVGAGFLGLALVQLARAHHVAVTVVSARPFSRQQALAMGARHAVALAEPWKVAELLVADNAPPEYPRVIEATGHQEGLDVASALCATGGRLTIAGYHQDGLRQVNLQQWNWKGLDVINAHERDPARYLRGMAAAIQAAEQGHLDLTSLLTHRYRLEEIGQAYHDLSARPRGFIKGYITFGNATEDTPPR